MLTLGGVSSAKDHRGLLPSLHPPFCYLGALNRMGGKHQGFLRGEGWEV